MLRRDFLKYSGSAAVTALIGRTSLAAEPAQDTWMYEFTSSEKIWKLGYQTPASDLAAADIPVKGHFPLATVGTLFRNGPAIHDLGGMRNHHWFDGDGMVQRFSIGENKISHLGRVIQTRKYQAEMAQHKRLYNAFGTVFANSIPASSADTINVANTSVLPLQDELLALWEGGSAYALDPVSLEARGVKKWGEQGNAQLNGLPFSAHPKIDTQGTIWNFGIDMQRNMMVLYQIDANGKLRRAAPLRIPNIAMVHDFVVSDRHLIFLLPPLVMDVDKLRSGNSYLDSHQWRPELGTRILVIDKSDWSNTQWLELPAGFLFHTGNAWEDANGVIHLDYVHAADPDALFDTTRNVMRAAYPHIASTQIAKLEIDTKVHQVKQELITLNAEFPRVDPRLVGQRHRHLFLATKSSATRPLFQAITRLDMESGKTEAYDYGADHIAEEHIFVPDKQDGTGWVLGTALDLTRKVTKLSCFRADRLNEGPVAQASLPYALPLGLHGAFVAA
jgi:all-trans-8'-apo-beta-carotenal 15,15'-oxygenase